MMLTESLEAQGDKPLADQRPTTVLAEPVVKQESKRKRERIEDAQLRLRSGNQSDVRALAKAWSVPQKNPAKTAASRTCAESLRRSLLRPQRR